MNDPHGLRSTFLRMTLPTCRLTYRTPEWLCRTEFRASGSPFAGVASDLNTFTNDLTKLPGRNNYVLASPYLVAAANSLNDAANQVNSGICDNSGNPNCNGSQFLADMGAVPNDFLEFSIAESAPEPSSLILLGSSVLGVGGLLRKRWPARG